MANDLLPSNWRSFPEAGHDDPKILRSSNASICLRVGDGEHAWNILQRHSTILTADRRLEEPRVRRIDQSEFICSVSNLPDDLTVDHFGDHVAFDVTAWHPGDSLHVGAVAIASALFRSTGARPQ